MHLAAGLGTPTSGASSQPAKQWLMASADTEQEAKQAQARRLAAYL